MSKTPAARTAATVIALFASVALVAGQTKITAPSNKYSVADDVKLGQEAARQVEQELPLLDDNTVESYLANLGNRLAAVIPAEFEHPEFRYTFKVVNVREINAFALPGGPMYVNRGMIQAAATEGEVVGVMAHELSHVALRHGTAQQSKATPFQIGSIAGAVIGAIIGGTAGRVVAEGTQFGLGTAFLRYSRDYEKQADLLGAQIMARAGYDPRDMANMFKTIEKTSGNGGPQFLSDHPNPSNRYEYITSEAKALQVVNPITDTRGFNDIQQRLKRMAPAPTTEEATRARGRSSGSTDPGRIGRVDPPSTSFRTYNEGNLFRISVPSNWEELPDNSSVTFSPRGGHGSYNGQNVFTHGVQAGLSRSTSRDLRMATDNLIDSLAQGNPRLRGGSSYDSVTIDGRRGLRMVLSNVSDVTNGDERIDLFTTQLRDGSLFYVLGVAPADEFGTYQRVFAQVVRSIRLND